MCSSLMAVGAALWMVAERARYITGVVFFRWCGAHRVLHSFPTRRSSDLPFGPSFDVVGWFARDIDVFERVGAVLLGRSEEHTSELQSQSKLVCRLLPEKKKS